MESVTAFLKKFTLDCRPSMEQDAVLIGAASRQNTTDMLHEITGISRKHTPSSVRLEINALVRAPKVRARTYILQVIIVQL